MAEKRNYFARRIELMERAKNHVGYMNANYNNLIEKSVAESIVYGFPSMKPDMNGDLDIIYNSIMSGNETPEEMLSPALRYALKYPGNHTVDKTPKIKVVPYTTEEAVFDDVLLEGAYPVVLNFASYKNPGGKFIEGSSAQEESLCHVSTLYNVLVNFKDYYGYNNTRLNRGLYTNRAIYSPNIVFDQAFGPIGVLPKYADVITCAAPNWSAVSKYNHATYEENLSVLKDRIGFIFRVFGDYEESVGYGGMKLSLILGAFGCGVFGQSATEVGKFFMEYINDGWADRFDSVIFAVPPGRNYDELAAVVSTMTPRST